MILAQLTEHFTVKEASDSARAHLLIPQGKETVSSVLRKSSGDINVNILKNVYFTLVCFLNKSYNSAQSSFYSPEVSSLKKGRRWLLREVVRAQSHALQT